MKKLLMQKFYFVAARLYTPVGLEIAIVTSSLIINVAARLYSRAGLESSIVTSSEIITVATRLYTHT